MAGFSELIKNFDKTRDYVRNFFIYGFKVRDDFKTKSSRTYDDEKRRIESWLGDCLKYDDSVRGRQIAISVDSCHIDENPLYQAYCSKSFTENDIRLHFLLLDVLSDNKEMPLRDIVDTLNDEYGQLFDEQTVRNKLREYVSEGLIFSHKQGKTAYFSLTPDRIDEYFEDFKGFEDMVKFFSQTQTFGFVGNTMLKTMGLKNDMFLMKHNYLIHTLEDSILPVILDAVKTKSCISFINQSLKDHAQNEDSKERTDVIPLRIFSSVQTGRRYLAAYHIGYKRFNTFRLDYIKEPKVTSACADFDYINEKFEKSLSKCFGVSFGERRENGAFEPLEITLYIDEDTEGYVLERVQREKRCCTVEKTGEHLYTITADIFDCNEIMTWVKSFIGRVVSIEGGTQKVRNRFLSDIHRMKKIYGGENDEHIQRDIRDVLQDNSTAAGESTADGKGDT